MKKLFALSIFFLFAPLTVSAYSRVPSGDDVGSSVLYDMTDDLDLCAGSNWHIHYYIPGGYSLWTETTTGTTQTVTCGEDIYDDDALEVISLSCTQSIISTYLSCTDSDIGTYNNDNDNYNLVDYTEYFFSGSEEPQEQAETYGDIMVGIGIIITISLGLTLGILIMK